VRPDLLRFETDNNGTVIILNRENIKTMGREVIGKFLKTIQIYRSTADFTNANILFEKYSEVTEFFLKLREEVKLNSKPRPVRVQPKLTINSDQIIYHDYSPDYEGFLQ